MRLISKTFSVICLVTSTFVALPSEVFAFPKYDLKPPQISNLEILPTSQELVHILKFQLEHSRKRDIGIGKVTEFTVRAKAVDGYNAVILCTYRIGNNDKYRIIDFKRGLDGKWSLFSFSDGPIHSSDQFTVDFIRAGLYPTMIAGIIHNPKIQKFKVNLQYGQSCLIAPTGQYFCRIIDSLLSNVITVEGIGSHGEVIQTFDIKTGSLN